MKQRRMCVLYARVSTDDQAEKYGLASQIRELKAYAEQHSYTVAGLFRDDGYSGETLDRPGLTKVRELARERLIDVIVCFEPDRLSRSLAHQLLLQDEFENAGVRHEYVTITVSGNHEGKLMLNIKGVIAEYEKEKIKERTMRGRREKAKQGLFPGGRRTYGYLVRDGLLTPCETEAPVVRNIFEWFTTGGLSLRQIVLRLNEGGHKPHTGERWAKSSVNRILTNESYIGRAYYNRRRRLPSRLKEAGRKDNKTRHDWKPTAEWIQIIVPALIDEAIFQSAQRKLTKNREQRSGRPSKNKWLLRGLLRCGKCGRRYAGHPSKLTLSYRCGGRDRVSARPCNAKLINANQVESLVLHEITDILANPKMLASKLMEVANSERNREDELTSIENRLSSLQPKEKKLLDAYLDGCISQSAMRERSRDLKLERENLEQSRRTVVDAIRLRSERVNVISMAEAYCAKLKNRLQGADFATKRDLLATVIDEIIVDDGGYEIKGAVSFHVQGVEPSTTC